MCLLPSFPTVQELSVSDYCTAALAKLKAISFRSINIRSITRKYDDVRSMQQYSKLNCLHR